jgi:hypothetical protein
MARARACVCVCVCVCGCGWLCRLVRATRVAGVSVLELDWVGGWVEPGSLVRV